MKLTNEYWEKEIRVRQEKITELTAENAELRKRVIEEIYLIAHGGSKNDTIMTIETKSGGKL
jgi:hypothetical protein